MDRIDLLNYKNSLETTIYKVGKDGIEGPFLLSELNLDSTNRFTCAAYNYFRNAIKLLSSKCEEYEAIDLDLNIRLLYESNDISINEELVEGALPLGDYVEIQIADYDKIHNKSRFFIKDKETIDNYHEPHIVRFHDLLNELNKMEFTLAKFSHEIEPMEHWYDLVNELNENDYSNIIIRLDLQKEDEIKRPFIKK